MQTYKHIIFDFDGTIANSVPIFLKIYNELATEKNFKLISAETIPQIRHLSYLKRAEYLGIPLYQIPFIIPVLYKKYKQNIQFLQAYDGIFDFLTTLQQQGFTLDIVSSNSKENILQFLDNQNFTHFKNIYCSENFMGKDKVLKKLLKATEYPLRECLYIGDENRDIEACMKISMDCAWVNWGYEDELQPQLQYYPKGHFKTHEELQRFICKKA
ncbi:HAD hydrolase-like protein [Flectobacillus sp. BAB-3569]|uniref:HAD hydrolase-like protein n=1 Tax=Flectobacillus sp. BAB-3569 TaxID=1509483 RepID=UPI000BA41FD1|nr:HAD hydrolase-like protein [Flectobacillus sp. BAB-3569]PAC27328.1 HAD family hydrolase [Flectobacillus sp. BAB-3569]